MKYAQPSSGFCTASYQDWGMWRTHPAVRRAQLFDLAVTRSTFDGWCTPPVTVRLYQRREAEKAGSAVAVLLPDPTMAPRVFDGARFSGEDVTVLINGVEKVDETTVGEIGSCLLSGPDWRLDDAVSTLSSAGSGIGFHAGHEDGFIVQLAGKRRWRVWHRDVLDDTYLHFLLGKGNNEYEVVPERPNSRPLIDTTLEPGDALYIPAMFPHEGITLEESISFSFAWRGFSPFTLLRRYFGSEILESLESAAATNTNYFAMLPDPPLPDVSIPDFLTASVAALVDVSQELGLSLDELRSRLRWRLSSEGRV